MIDRRLLIGSGLAGAVALFSMPSRANPLAKGNYPVTRSEAAWKKQLGAQRFHILREAGTERPYSSPLNKEKRAGTFVCAGCAKPLYSSKTKFESGTGWPSFYRALPGAVEHTADNSLLMRRTEEHCARCGGHLGHVFDDGPPPTGKRHCINGLALKFKPA